MKQTSIKKELKNTEKEKKLKIAAKLKFKVAYENRIGQTGYTDSQGCC